MKSHSRKSLYLAIAVALAVLSGCATHGAGMGPALSAMSRGDYQASITEVEKGFAKKKNEQLVYNMDMGLLEHLNAQYDESNSNLQTAAALAEDLETKRVGNLIKETMSSPRSGPYAGTKYEKVFIHYYKALNYILLASRNPDQKSDYIEKARIEARQIDIKLTAILKEEGTYDEVKDKKKSFIGKLMKVFNDLEGNMDKDMLIYREDAYIRYLTGIVYEKNGEFDDARVSYQNAAELYEKGYAKQYGLGSEMTELAWLDTIRVMRDSGDWEGEWQKLAEDKLSEPMRKRLKEFEKGKGQLIIIQGTGRVPAREQMSFQMKLDVSNKALVLKPVFWGAVNSQEKEDAMAWFSSMYAETGVISVMSNYMDRGVEGAVEGIFTKRISLSPVWAIAKAIKLPETMKVMNPIGVRVTVPYYRPLKPGFLDTNVFIDGNQAGKLADAESIARLALFEQFLNAASDLKKAVVREIVKNTATATVGNALGGGLLALGGGLMNMATSAAETRNWLTLPYNIRVQRYPLPAGKHRVELRTDSSFTGMAYNETSEDVEIEKGKISVICVRAIAIAETAAGTKMASNN